MSHDLDEHAQMQRLRLAGFSEADPGRWRTPAGSVVSFNVAWRKMLEPKMRFVSDLEIGDRFRDGRGECWEVVRWHKDERGGCAIVLALRGYNHSPNMFAGCATVELL